MDEDLELSLNVPAMCRVCLTENQPKMKSIFTREIVNGNIVLFPEVYKMVTNLTADKNDGLPENICETCRKKISEIYTFKDKCANSDKLLRKILKLPPSSNENAATKTMISTFTQTVDIKKERKHMCIQTIDLKKSTTKIVSTQTTFNEKFNKIDAHTQTAFISGFVAEEQNVADHQEVVEHIYEMEGAAEPSFHESDETTSSMDTPNRQLFIKVEREEMDEGEVGGDGQEREEYEEEEEEEAEVEKVHQLNDDEEGGFEEEFLVDTYDIQVVHVAPSDSDDVKRIMNKDGEAIDEAETYPEVDEMLPAILEYNNKYHHLPIDNEKNQQTVDMDCEICHLILKPKDVERHKRFHKEINLQVFNNTKYYRCGNCFSVFVNIDEYENHFEQSANCNSAESDKSCTDYQFLDDNEMTSNQMIPKQMYSMTKQNDFFCDYCGDQLIADDFQSLLRHFDHLHFNVGTKDAVIENAHIDYENLFWSTYRCGSCEETFTSLVKCIQHVFCHLEMFVCPVDKCVAAEHHSLNEYITHTENYHMNSMRDIYKCSKCSKEFKSQAWFQTHISQFCTNIGVKCGVCDKVFTKYQALKSHYRCHSNERRFKCDVCEKRFMQKGDLNIHIRIHTGDRPYDCPKCPKKFRSLANRNDHMSTHEEERKFQCNICQQAFISVRTLRGHIKLHELEKRFECNFCNKKFHRRTHVQSHMKIHIKKTTID